MRPMTIAKQLRAGLAARHHVLRAPADARAACGRPGPWVGERTIDRSHWIGHPWPRVCERCRRATDRPTTTTEGATR